MISIPGVFAVVTIRALVFLRAVAIQVVLHLGVRVTRVAAHHAQEFRGAAGIDPVKLVQGKLVLPYILAFLHPGFLVVVVCLMSLVKRCRDRTLELWNFDDCLR